MQGGPLVMMLQALGRIPGLEFCDRYANQMIMKAGEVRSYRERGEELRDRGKEVKRTAGEVAGGGGDKSGKSSRTRGRDRGIQGSPESAGGHRSGRDSAGQNDDFWGSPSSGPNSSGRGGARDRRTAASMPQHGRLRRKNYDL